MINENHKYTQKDASSERSLPQAVRAGAIICLTEAHYDWIHLSWTLKSFKLHHADLLENCSSELSQLKNDIFILENNICNQIFSQRPRQTGKWAVFCRLRPRTALNSSSSPLDDSVQTGVGWRHSKLLVYCILIFKIIFHPSSLHGDDDQQAHAELLPSLLLMWCSSRTNPCMSHHSRSFAIS